MRSFLTLLFSVFTLFLTIEDLAAQHKKKINFYELDVIRGLFFQPNTIAPYTGTAFEEFADGRKKMQVPIKDGKMNGTIKEWSVNGQKVFEASYDMGVQTGMETQWFANGQKSLEIAYTNGVPDGVCTEWFKHGRKKSQGLFVKGKEEGEHLWWHLNGQLDQQLTYKNGKAEGLVKNWYQSGQLKLESEYRAGLKHGKITRWYANGAKHTEGYFVDGKEDGEERTWSKYGLLEGLKIFKNGELEKEYNYRSGNIFLGKSYLQVINERESFFMIEVKGGRVFPRWTNGLCSYSVDGDLLQIFNYPISNFIAEEESVSDEKDLLTRFQANEYEILEKKYGVALEVNKEFKKRTDGKQYLYWSFPVPPNYQQREGAKKVQAEHFISVICNKQVLNLRSLVMEGENAQNIQQMLERTVKTLRVENERIDLNSVMNDR